MKGEQLYSSYTSHLTRSPFDVNGDLDKIQKTYKIDDGQLFSNVNVSSLYD